MQKPRLQSYLNGVIEHFPWANGVERQIAIEIDETQPKLYFGFFVTGYLSIAYPLTVGIGLGLLKRVTSHQWRQ